MSTMAPEAPPAPTAATGRPAKQGNIFTRKLGPLPMWAWLLIGIALILGFVYYRSKTSAASPSQTPTGTDASQVPQFVNQTYTTVQPPSTTGQIESFPPIPTGTGSGSGGTGGGSGGGRPPLRPDTRYTERVQQNNITLATFAKRHKWSPGMLAQVEKLNNLRPGSRLKKGQQLIAPA